MWIKEGCEEIEDLAFASDDAYKNIKIYLPSTIRYIHNDAFSWNDYNIISPENRTIQSHCSRKDELTWQLISESAHKELFSPEQLLEKEKMEQQKLAEQQRRAEEERKKQQEAIQKAKEEQARIQSENARIEAERIRQGVCRYCGGEFKGLFSKKCSNCGAIKDYKK